MPSSPTPVPGQAELDGILSTIQDLFGSGIAWQPRDLGDVFAELHLTASEGLAECTRAVTFSRRDECSECVHGPCEACGGRGMQAHQRQQVVFDEVCNVCSRLGRVVKTPCGRCDNGWRNVRETVNVTVPPSLPTRSQLRVPGKGQRVGDQTGALVVTVIVDGGGALVRRGDDVVTERLVPLDTLLEGGRLDLVDPHDVPFGIDVPRGTHDGTVLVVAGRGYAQSDATPVSAGAAYRERSARGAMRVTVRLSAADRERVRARQRGRRVMVAGMILGISVVVIGLMSMAQR